MRLTKTLLLQIYSQRGLHNARETDLFVLPCFGAWHCSDEQYIHQVWTVRPYGVNIFIELAEDGLWGCTLIVFADSRKWEHFEIKHVKND